MAAAFGTEGLKALSELPVTTKDGKAIVPAITSFFENFQGKLTSMFDEIRNEFQTMFTDFKKELLDLEKEKDAKVKKMEVEVVTLKKQIANLEERIEDSEAYERRDALIISGSKVPPARENEDCVQVVRNLTRQHLNLSIPENEISIAHTLRSTSSSSQNNRSIIVKFCRRNMKSDVMNAARRLKVQNLFMNECLTPTQRKIGFVLRKAKREFPAIVSGSTTFEGKHHVWTKPPNPNAPGARDSKHIISSIDRLENFCTRVLNKPMSEFFAQ